MPHDKKKDKNHDKKHDKHDRDDRSDKKSGRSKSSVKMITGSSSSSKALQVSQHQQNSQQMQLSTPTFQYADVLQDAAPKKVPKSNTWAESARLYKLMGASLGDNITIETLLYHFERYKAVDIWRLETIVMAVIFSCPNRAGEHVCHEYLFSTQRPSYAETWSSHLNWWVAYRPGYHIFQNDYSQLPMEINDTSLAQLKGYRILEVIDPADRSPQRQLVPDQEESVWDAATFTFLAGFDEYHGWAYLRWAIQLLYVHKRPDRIHDQFLHYYHRLQNVQGILVKSSGRMDIQVTLELVDLGVQLDYLEPLVAMANEYKTAKHERRETIKETFATAKIIYEQLRIMLERVREYNENCWESDNQHWLYETVVQRVWEYEKRIEESSGLLRR